jgi:predicted PurR-regulated permease PerM
MRLVGVDFAGFWALLIFVLNFIPIIGAISAISAPVLLALVQPDGGADKALLALVLLVGVEQTMSSVIEPRLIGRTVNLSPLVILLSLAVWGTLWGFAGLLLAVPITVTVMIILTQFPDTRWAAILLSDSGQIAPIKHPAPAAA